MRDSGLALVLAAVLAAGSLESARGGSAGEAAPATRDPAIAFLLERGNAAWARRAEGHRDGVADHRPIGDAVDAYQAALEGAPRDLEIRWRLLRALFFLGDFTSLDEASRLAVFARGRRTGEIGIDQLAARLGGRESLSRLDPREVAARLGDELHAPPIFFWTAVHWGKWGELRGRFAAARQGVGGTIRDYGRIVVALDETWDSAAGLRVLGRLHTEAPRVPFFTGWVDRDLALRHLTRAVELAPDDYGNRLFLAECLAEHFPDRRDEALEILRDLASRQARPDYLVEELQVLEDARVLLAGLRPDRLSAVE